MESQETPDLRVSIWTSIAIPWIAALICTVLRVCARKMTKISLWFDDYFAILAFVFATGYVGIMVEWTLHTYFGIFLPADMPLDQREAILTQSRKLSFFNSLCYASSIACSKIAILCLYWRLFKTSSIKIPILVLLVIVGIWIIIRTCMLPLRCLPVASLWDHSIEGVCRINSEQFFLGTIATHFILDIVILVLPLVEVFRLRIRLGQKLAVAASFLLGLIVCIASAIVLAILVTPSQHPDQPTYAYVMFCVWGSVEVNIAVVSACFPLLRPIFSYVFPKGALSSYAVDSRRIGGNSYPFNSSGRVDSRATKKAKTLTLVRSKLATDDDDAGSTQELTVWNYEKSFEPISQRDHHGVRTFISSGDSTQRPGQSSVPGIYVSTDTTIEIEIGSRK